ncbi:glycerate kinase [Raoultibacter phocaeensis]|uniref:glycerate kinase n=1 Tax=Raoultibacter phocaeensis TaxID=2479841 RepID=UPI0015D5A4A9|nr:glycerate kinase [Raoultibacter phocaeensis]
MKIVVAPDSFKGSLSAQQVAAIVRGGLAARIPACEIVEIPLADGGEGSLEAILAVLGGRIEQASVLSPDKRQITAQFGVTAGGKAVLEAAQSCGITRQIGLHPMDSNTYGFGQLILQALDRGLRDFILCLGGTATTDGGCGMAAALGAEFSDSENKGFVPNGATLGDIARVNMSGVDARVRQSSFMVFCDVDNPLYGPTGAAFVYGPQKGADAEQVRTLDDGLRHLGGVMLRASGIDCAHVPGSGAGGGLGFGCATMLGARLVRGIDAVLDLYDFRHRIADADLVVTGEGKLDAQSFSGKVLSGVLRAAEAGAVPVVSICGTCTCEKHVLREHGLTVFEASEGSTVEESLQYPERHLREATSRVADSLRKRSAACRKGAI